MSQSEDELFNSSVVPYKVLIVCEGNTCRSIIYESLFTFQQKKTLNIQIKSAGYKVVEKNISGRAVSSLSYLEMPIVKTEPTPLEDYSGEHFDEVIVLDENVNGKTLKNLTYKKLRFYPLEDPKGKDLDAYKKVIKECFDLIEP